MWQLPIHRSRPHPPIHRFRQRQQQPHQHRRRRRLLRRRPLWQRLRPELRLLSPLAPAPQQSRRKQHWLRRCHQRRPRHLSPLLPQRRLPLPPRQQRANRLRPQLLQRPPPLPRRPDHRQRRRGQTPAPSRRRSKPTPRRPRFPIPASSWSLPLLQRRWPVAS